MANIPTVTHSEATPAGTDYIREGDDRIRELKTQFREVIAVDHKMDSAGQGATWGMHQLVTFIQGVSPAAVADKCILFAEDVAAVPQVKCKHEKGYEEQITGIGKYDQNVMIEVQSDTTVDVDALFINIQGQVEGALNITIDCSGTGADGMDTGALGASTWYFVFAIYDTTNSVAAGLISASSTTPTMPANYVLKRLIGYVLTDASSDLLVSFQFMNSFRWDIPITITTTVSSGAWSGALDCSASIPTGVRMGMFELYVVSNAADAKVAMSIRANGSTGQDPSSTTGNIYGYYVYAIGGQVDSALDSSQQIQYYNYSDNTVTATSIKAKGFICGLF